MSKFDDVVGKCAAQMDKLGIKYDADLLRKVAKGLGPSIYNKDSSTVSCSDQSELDRVKANYLIKKLGLADSPELDAAVKEVCEKMGSSTRNKYRPNFYYLLMEKFGKQDVYA